MEIQKDKGYLRALLYGLVNPEVLKDLSIKILDDTQATEEQKQRALKFAEDYKVYMEFVNSLPDGERAICVDQNGRRTDLRAR